MSKNSEPMKQCPNCEVGNKMAQRRCWNCKAKFPSLKELKKLRVAKFKQANLLEAEDER